MKKEDVGTESFCAKTKLLNGSLTEEFLPITALRETELNIQTNQTNIKFMAILTLQVLVAKNKFIVRQSGNFLRSEQSWLIPLWTKFRHFFGAQKVQF